jgi:ectoine hydroxylase-related dioxygenase (phytanoyl-CoA dioxygenase family)
MAWRRSVEQHGFAVVPGVFSPRELIPLVVSLADLAPHSARAGVRHVLGHPAVSVIARHQRLLGMAQEILGQSAFPFRATLFDKSPDSNWLITWHQDTALPLRERHETPGWGPWSVKEGVTYAHAPASALWRVLALRVHLDESTEENGPLRVLPGTHSMGVLSDDAISQLATETSAVKCLVPKGGVLVMRPLLIHASSKSQPEASSRRVLHVEYATCSNLGEGLQLAIA